MGRIQKSTWFLSSCAQAFVLALAVLPAQEGGGLAGEGLFLAALDGHVGQANLLENSHHIYPPITV